MRRRRFLATSGTGALLGVSGCIDGLDQPDESEAGGDTESEDETDVPGCTQKTEWTDDITSGPADPDPESIAGRRECANADRPEPAGDVCDEQVAGERTHDSVGVEPYPDPPETFDEESLTTFVSEYERVYTHNRAVLIYGKRVVGSGFTIHANETLDLYDAITAVRIEFGYSQTINGPDGEVSSYNEDFGTAAIYGIDETGIVRAEAEPDPSEFDPESAPDLFDDGRLLECF